MLVFILSLALFLDKMYILSMLYISYISARASKFPVEPATVELQCARTRGAIIYSFFRYFLSRYLYDPLSFKTIVLTFKWIFFHVPKKGITLIRHLEFISDRLNLRFLTVNFPYHKGEFNKTALYYKSQSSRTQHRVEMKECKLRRELSGRERYSSGVQNILWQCQKSRQEQRR